MADGKIHSDSVYYNIKEKLIREIHYHTFDEFCFDLLKTII